MARLTDDSEASLYLPVERWMKRHFRCFKTGVNVGLAYSRVDVLGIRDIGGDLSGEIDTISHRSETRLRTVCNCEWASVGIQSLCQSCVPCRLARKAF